MNGHDIIVIGASAGGLKALNVIVADLPADINATIFIVQHLAPDQPSLLPKILGSVSSLPVSHAVDGEPIERGRIYVAPPDHHLLVNQGYLRVVHGPHENRFRPAIDALFRSAARAYGPRVVGVVLTGYLDDGTIGLQSIKKRGGVAIVQDPSEAEYSGMPQSAMRYVKVDHHVLLAEIPKLLQRLVDEPSEDEAAYPVPIEIEFESNIAEQRMNTKEFLENVEKIGTLTSYGCPNCGGSIWQIGKDQPSQFRCHVGHAYTANVFRTEQSERIESSLWEAVRTLEEKVTFSRQMATESAEQGHPGEAIKYEEYAMNVDEEVSIIRNIILHGYATQRHAVSDEED